MYLLEIRNRYFYGLFNNPKLMRRGRNINHVETHPAVVKVLTEPQRSNV